MPSRRPPGPGCPTPDRVRDGGSPTAVTRRVRLRLVTSAPAAIVSVLRCPNRGARAMGLPCVPCIPCISLSGPSHK
jgi:hypothetical protein